MNPSPFRLSDTHLTVLELLVKGDSNKQIGYHLGISEKTVESHVTTIYKRLKVENRVQAAVKALREGIMK